jgi:hypothetical protein
MVDLVKIRKKAKEKKKEEAAAPAAEPVVQEVAPAPSEAPVKSNQPTTNDQQPTTNAPNPSKLTRFLETAGQQHVAEKKQEAETGQQLELLTFAINREQYAVAIDGVVIITPRPVTRVPNADPSVVGILSLRGTIVVLIDVRSRLGHPPAGPRMPIRGSSWWNAKARTPVSSWTGFRASSRWMRRTSNRRRSSTPASRMKRFAASSGTTMR